MPAFDRCRCRPGVVPAAPSRNRTRDGPVSPPQGHAAKPLAPPEKTPVSPSYGPAERLGHAAARARKRVALLLPKQAGQHPRLPDRVANPATRSPYTTQNPPIQRLFLKLFPPRQAIIRKKRKCRNAKAETRTSGPKANNESREASKRRKRHNPTPIPMT